MAIIDSLREATAFCSTIVCCGSFPSILLPVDVRHYAELDCGKEKGKERQTDRDTETEKQRPRERV